MKHLMKFLTVALMLFAFSVSAQEYSRPFQKSVLSSFAVPGITTTNLPSSLQNTIPVGPNGVGLSFYVYGTNAATTTNATVVLQGSVDGFNWFDTPSTVSAITVLVPQNGTAVYSVYTNLAPNTVTVQNLGNLSVLRIKSIQNTNIATMWVSNVVASVR